MAVLVAKTFSAKHYNLNWLFFSASSEPQSSFTCGPQGIKHHTNDSEILGKSPCALIL